MGKMVRGKRVREYDSAPKSAINKCNLPPTGAYEGDYGEGRGVGGGIVGN